MHNRKCVDGVKQLRRVGVELRRGQAGHKEWQQHVDCRQLHPIPSVAVAQQALQGKLHTWGRTDALRDV